MATIKTPVEGFTGTVVGVDFKDGVGETTNIAALEYFERQGYGIDEAEPPFPAGKPGKKWTIEQLKAWADSNGVDLGNAGSKDEILTTIYAPKDSTDPVKSDGE